MSVTAGVDTDLATFLEVLFPGDDGFMEFRAIAPPVKHRVFIPLGDLAAVASFLAAHLNQNVYTGCASRRTATTGTRANCHALAVLFVDLDFKQVDEATARARLAAFPLPPTLIVRSGGGLHVYWLLKEAFQLPDDADDATIWLRRVALALGGDLASAEPVHVLRVPGSFNHKPEYGMARPVVLEHSDLTAIYNLSDFEEWLPPEPTPPPGATKGEHFHVPLRIVGGERNTRLYQSGRSMHAKGWSDAAILAALLAENTERCEPPLPRDEVAAIARNAATQADRPDFAAKEPAGATPEPTVVAEPFPAFCDRLTFSHRPPDLVPELVPGLGLTMLHGHPRALKTWTLQEIACALTTATPVFGLARFTIETARTVWFVTDEDPELVIRDRFLSLLQGRACARPSTLHVSVQRGLLLDDPAWQRAMMEYTRTAGVQLTIVDPIRSSSSAVDQGPRELAPLRDFLRGFMRDTGSGLVLGHHDVKPPAGKPDDRATPHRASGGGIFSIADAPIHAERVDSEGSQTLLTPTQYKFSTAPAPVLLTLSADNPTRPTWVRLTGADAASGSTAHGLAVQRQVLHHVRTHPNLSGTQIVRDLRRNKQEVLVALDALQQAGLVDFYEKGRAHLWFAVGSESSGEVSG